MYQDSLYAGLYLDGLKSLFAEKSATETSGQRRPLTHRLILAKPLVAWVGEKLVLVGMKLQKSQQLNHRLSIR